MHCIVRAVAFSRVAAVIGLVVAVSTSLPYDPAISQTRISYPSRPITVIVPFAKGGPTDVVARIVAVEMSKTLGQPVAIENVVGAGGTTATQRAARAEPDGYTLIVGHMGTHAAAVALYPNLGYRPDADFAPVALLSRMPVLVVARQHFPAADFGEFVSYVRGHTHLLNMAHAGVGSVSYASCTLLNHLLGIDPTGVPFNGTAPAMEALAAGQVDYMCDQIVNVVVPLRDGAVRAYVIASPQRDPALPTVPTAAEAGLPAFEVEAWNALFAPKGTPDWIVAMLNTAVVRALDQPEVRNPLIGLGGIVPSPDQRTPDALRARVQAELQKWGQVLKRSSH
ncbi:tripartite tricarboxylate transporter substrate-binding protein [Rhodopseudomonas sp. NSM]|uniref:tripartite tricarboxylate transporter substrate-binding protein n=1 Tax=Rhodopseudomonas sp. NSM TaxID=3457630 RepID=UPI0040352B59